MGYIDDVAGDLYSYDGTSFAYDWDPIQQVVWDYLTTSNKV